MSTPLRTTALLLALAANVSADEPAPIELPGVHNAYRVTTRLFSGSQPEGDAAFAALAQLGVKTILSVDGAKPDVEAARKHGLRYIHLPIGYDGVPAKRLAELARAAATPGPIFVHCHHGKHRGPAALGVMCETTEGWSRARAEAWLRQAGTAEDYPGLYRAVREFSPFAKEQLDRIGTLPEIAETPALVDAMVAIDERFDRLKAHQRAGWAAPSQEDATLLWEQLRELARTADTASRPEDYRQKLAASEQAAAALRTAARDPAALDAAFQRIGQSCSACHKSQRNERK